MSVFEENLREEIRKLERKYEDQKTMNEKLVSKCSGKCNKSEYDYFKSMLLVCLDLLEKSQPKDPQDSPEWLARKFAMKTVIDSL